MINFRSLALTLLVSGIAWQALGQYPEVPPELQEKADQIMEAEKERLDALWQEQLPVRTDWIRTILLMQMET